MSKSKTALAIPITAAMRQRAEQKAQMHPDPQVGAQIARNLLAVEVTQFYLKMLSIDSEAPESEASDRQALQHQGPELRLQQGCQSRQLACLPVAPGDVFCQISEGESEELSCCPERLGYMAVEIPIQMPRSARLLGFAGAIGGGQVAIAHFQPLDVFLQRLHRPPAIALGLDQPKLHSKPQSKPQPGQTPKPKLNPEMMQRMAHFWNERWIQPKLQALAFRSRRARLASGTLPSEPEPLCRDLEQLVRSTPNDEELRWQAADLLWTLDPEHEAAGVRRMTDLGLQFGKTSVALMVATLPRPDGNRAILLRLYPMGEAKQLPEGIELVGCDDQGQTFLSAQARELDDYIQLKFAAHPEEAFTVKVLMEGTGVAEHFIA